MAGSAEHILSIKQTVTADSASTTEKRKAAPWRSAQYWMSDSPAVRSLFMKLPKRHLPMPGAYPVLKTAFKSLRGRKDDASMIFRIEPQTAFQCTENAPVKVGQPCHCRAVSVDLKPHLVGNTYPTTAKWICRRGTLRHRLESSQGIADRLATNLSLRTG